MKLCPACHRTYENPALNFCLQDGTPLTNDLSTNFDPQQTLINPTPLMTTPTPPASATFQPTLVAQPSPLSLHGVSTQSPSRGKRNTVWVIGAAVLALALLVTGASAALVWILSTKPADTSNVNSNLNRNSGSSVNSNSANGQKGGSNQSETNANHYAASTETTNSSADSPGLKEQAAVSNNSSETTNKPTPSPSTSPVNTAPYAEFTNRVGRYTGQAYNTTTGARGNAVIDLTSVNPSTGAVSVRMNFSGNLCGTGASSGRISQQGGMNLVGSIFCGNNFRMITSCNFSGPGRLKCSYRVAGSGISQAGVFDVSKG